MDRLTPQGALKLLVQRPAGSAGAPHAGPEAAVTRRLGFWEHDLASGELQWSADTYRIFGVAPESFQPNTASFFGFIHPDDRQRMADMLAHPPAPGVPVETEYRIVRADGAVRTLYERGEVTLDEHGKVTRKLGIVLDITESRAAEEEALAAAEELGRIVRVLQEIASANLDQHSLMQLMAERAQELTRADSAVIEMVDGATMLCEAASGPAMPQVGTRLPIHNSLSGAAVLLDETVISHDTEADPRVNLEVARLVNARSVVAAPLRAGDTVIGVLKVMAARPAAFGRREMHSMQILVSSLGAEIQQHRHAAELARSEAHYRLLFENNPQPMLIHDWPALRILAVNQAAVRHYGYRVQEFLGMQLADLWATEELSALEQAFAGLAPDERLRATFRHERRDGTRVDMEVVDDAIDFNGMPARLLTGTDVTERLRAQHELSRLNRAQRMLSACNEALVRAENEDELLQQICNIAVGIGDFVIAWVGYALDDDHKTIKPIVNAGVADEFLYQHRWTWAADDPAGNSAAGRCVRSGEMVLVADVMHDEESRPWLSRALKTGYRSVRSLPLREHGRAFGVLNLYSAEVAAIGEDEAALLVQMADNLAFGIASLRSRMERRRLQAAVMKVAAGVSAATGTAFFEQLALNMVEAVNADIAFISRVMPGDATRARTMALIQDGSVSENVSYNVDATVTGLVLREGSVSIQGNISHIYPGVVLNGSGVQSVVGQVLRNSHGQPIGVLCVEFRSISEDGEFIASMLQIFAARAAAELERQDADARIRDQASLLDKAQDAIIVRGVDDRVMYWNKSAERLYGWTQDEALGSPVAELVATDPAANAAATVQVLENGEWTGELTQRRKDGELFSIEGRWTLIRDEFGAPQSIFEINTDITSRKAAEREIQNLAFYDPLTKLPNRLLLLDRLQHALASSARTRKHGALLFIDLDNFKTLNDTLGHDQGDLLLREVALRLHASVREADSLARLGGDEFVVMLEGLSEERGEAIAQATNVAEKTLAALNQPYIFAGYQHHSTASIGVTLFNDQQDNVGDLLKRADLAMYQAKSAGRNTLRFFDPEMQKLATARVILEADLRHGLKQQEFILHYQPQVARDGRVIGVEALVRWQHGRRGLVSPAEFIPFAEETGLILPLGQWVLESACRQLAAWSSNPAAAKLQIAVNVSARQFRHADFVAHVTGALEKSGADPRGLKLELTESLLLEDVEETIERMNQLQATGVSFALDDFGTGYSSLAYLKRLPFEQIKIDQSFVRDVLTDPNDAAIARTVVALAHSLGLEVLAEGVETVAQRDFLAEHACDAYQGYLFARPLPIAQLDAWLAKGGK